MSRDYSSQLKALPEATPPRDLWPEIDATLATPKTAARWPWLATAAAVIVALLVAYEPDSEQQAPAMTKPRATDQWVAYSQALEEQLHSLRDTGVTYTGQHAAILSELEDRVASVDWQLALPLSQGERQELWQHRTALMRDLVAVETSNFFAASDPEQSARVARTLNQPIVRPVSYAF